MNDNEHQQLAQRLSELSLKDARKEIRTLDPDADMAYYRNAIWDEYHTLWRLPNAGLCITLVEKGEFRQTDHVIGGGPRGWKANKAEYRYAGARVEPLDRPWKDGR